VQSRFYIGKYVPQWEQDQFLSIHYAESLIGVLRFARPRSFNRSISEPRDSTQLYGYSCYQYGTSFNISEDCITLNGKFHICKTYRQLILTDAIINRVASKYNFK
jgi:hypothetical protein